MPRDVHPHPHSLSSFLPSFLSFFLSWNIRFAVWKRDERHPQSVMYPKRKLVVWCVLSLSVAFVLPSFAAAAAIVVVTVVALLFCADYTLTHGPSSVPISSSSSPLRCCHCRCSSFALLSKPTTVKWKRAKAVPYAFFAALREPGDAKPKAPTQAGASERGEHSR